MTTTTAPGMTVGQRIRWARKRKGLSQERLAVAIGTTRQVVIRWEKDKHLPNQQSRERLADATDQDPGFFRDGGTPDDDEEESELVSALLVALRTFVRHEQAKVTA